MPNDKPEFIANNTVQTEELKYKGKTIPYSVLKKEVALDLPGFLGYANGHLFISEEVPENFRNPQLIHEYIEFVELKDEKDRCLQASKRELEYVPDELKESYLEYREDFFARLVVYYKDYDDDAFRNRIEASSAFFKKITQ